MADVCSEADVCVVEGADVAAVPLVHAMATSVSTEINVRKTRERDLVRNANVYHLSICRFCTFILTRHSKTRLTSALQFEAVRGASAHQAHVLSIRQWIKPVDQDHLIRGTNQ